MPSVSNMGRVRSEPLPERTTGRQRGRILTPSLNRKGYRWFRICIPGRRPRSSTVHRAVAAAFLGVRSPDVQVNHKNGDKSDNRLENLEYVTCRENIQHCWRMGLHGTEHCRGEANPHAKLTAKDVKAIRELYPELSLSKLAARYSVTKANVSQIVRRNTWKHV